MPDRPRTSLSYHLLSVGSLVAGVVGVFAGLAAWAPLLDCEASRHLVGEAASPLMCRSPWVRGSTIGIAIVSIGIALAFQGRQKRLPGATGHLATGRAALSDGVPILVDRRRSMAP